MGRDKTGLAECWLTVEERLGDKQSCSQGRAKGVCFPSVMRPQSSPPAPTPMLYVPLKFFQGREQGKATYKH